MMILLLLAGTLLVGILLLVGAFSSVDSLGVGVCSFVSSFGRTRASALHPRLAPLFTTNRRTSRCYDGSSERCMRDVIAMTHPTNLRAAQGDIHDHVSSVPKGTDCQPCSARLDAHLRCVLGLRARVMHGGHAMRRRQRLHH